MGTRKHRKPNKKFRRTRSRKQKGGDNDSDLETGMNTGDITLIKKALDNGADVNVYNDYYFSSSYLANAIRRYDWAVRDSDNIKKKRYLDIINLLLKRGADVLYGAHHDGDTPLGMALHDGNINIIKLLMESETYKNPVDKELKRYDLLLGLYSAIGNGNIELLRFLLNHTDVNINDYYNSGDTPLFDAIEKYVRSPDIYTNGLNVIKFLLENGADLHSLNKVGRDTYKTPLDIIMNSNNDELKMLVKKNIIEKQIPGHLLRQQERLKVGSVMDKKKIPLDLAHKIMTDHFGGKKGRHTRKNRRRKK